MKTTLSILAILFASLSTVACGGNDCESRCEDRKECENATAAEKDADCKKLCENTDKGDDKDVPCKSELEKSNDCVESLDVCLSPEDLVKEIAKQCADEAKAVADCQAEEAKK